MSLQDELRDVIPAKAGIQEVESYVGAESSWMPAYAGMTEIDPQSQYDYYRGRP
jgi:hypothetical protein